MDEDKLNGYTCQHCSGEITIDAELSNKNWQVYRCLSCGSKTPLAPIDLLKLAENG